VHILPPEVQLAMLIFPFEP